MVDRSGQWRLLRGGRQLEHRRGGRLSHHHAAVGYSFGLPVGLSFIGKPWTEATLIKLAYAYEQAAKPRRAPRFLLTADLTRR